MSETKLIELLRSASINNEDFKKLENSPLLFKYLINEKPANIIKKEEISDSKKLFIIYEDDDELYCIDLKEDENISYEAASTIYKFNPELFIDMNFNGEAIYLNKDKISIAIFKAFLNNNKLQPNVLAKEFFMDANLMVNEYDLPKKKYTYYKDIEESEKQMKL